MNKKFKLHYFIHNCGDGSAAIELCESAEQAEERDEEAQEDEGWGESSNDSIQLILEDGKLFFQDYRNVDGKYQYVKIPLEEV